MEYKPKTISRVFDRNDLLLGSFYNEKRDFIPIQQIPELVRYAFISAEDKNFYKHSGYDPLGLLKAIIGFSMGQLDCAGPLNLQKRLFYFHQRSSIQCPTHTNGMKHL